MRILPHSPGENGRDYALRVLRENILSLDLAPGSMVSENELAAQLGLSRTPVREALMALSQVHLVDIYPQRGSAIALLDYTLVEEACFMRRVLECAVVEQACEMATDDDKVDLEDNIAFQRRCAEAGRFEALIPLDNAMHRMLFRIAHKEQIYEIMSSFTAHFDRVRIMSSSTKHERNLSDHRAIVRAVCEGDKATARAMMEAHLTRYRVDEASLRQSFPASYFKQS